MFTPLQLEPGQAFLRKFGFKQHDLDSFIVIEAGAIYTQSAAALRIARKLHGGWKLLYAFIVIPKPLRNFIYKLFARYRYKLFGKREYCHLPSDNERKRFL